MLIMHHDLFIIIKYLGDNQPFTDVLHGTAFMDFSTRETYVYRT